MDNQNNVLVICQYIEEDYHSQILFECDIMMLVQLSRDDTTMKIGVKQKQDQLNKKCEEILLLFSQKFQGIHLNIKHDDRYNHFLEQSRQFNSEIIYEYWNGDISMLEYIRQQILVEIQQCYINTLKNSIEQSIVFPNLVQEQRILRIVIWSKLQQYCNNDEEYEYYLDKLRQQEDQQQQINVFGIQQLIQGNELLIKYIKIPFMNREYIQNRILKEIECNISKSLPLLPQYIQSKQEQLVNAIRSYLIILIENLYELIDAVIQTQLNQQIYASNLHSTFQQLIITQLNRITYDYYELAYLQSKYSQQMLTLFQSIKHSYLSIIYDFYSYLLKLSLYSNIEYQCINAALQTNFTLSNQDSYKVIIKEYSNYLIELASTLLDDYYFYRPQYYDKKEQFIKMTLKTFFNLVESLQTITFQYPFNDFISQLNSNNIALDNNQLQSVIQIIDENCQLNLLQDYHYIHVIETQQLNNQATLIKLKFNNIVQSFLLQEYENSQILSSKFNISLWQQQQHTTDLDIPLVHYLQVNYQLNHNKIQYNIIKQVEQTSDINKLILLEEQNFKNPSLTNKKYRIPKKPIKFNTGGGVLAAKALASGLGTFIVDCMDEDIPWEDKFRNAGSTTVFAIMVGFLSARLPFIGIIIQQILLGYAIVITWRNNVINKKERLKNLFHLIFQIAVVVGFSLLGEQLISPKIWGIIIGGIVGGVLIGIYSKFLIPLMKDNLIQMLERIEDKITQNGLISKNVRDSMKIDQSTFNSLKPNKLNGDQFMSLFLFCLANELRYQYRVESDKRIKKLEKKQKSTTKLKMKLIDMEIQLNVWRDLKKGIKKISLYENSETIHKMIVGLVENFNIYY